MTALEFKGKYNVPLNPCLEGLPLSDKIDFTQLDYFIEDLKASVIPYRISQCADGFRVGVVGVNGHECCDVVLHIGSYGHKDGRLEFWTQKPHDAPVGWLTGSDAWYLADKERKKSLKGNKNILEETT